MRTFHHIGNGVYRVPMRRSAVTNQFIPEKEQAMNNVYHNALKGIFNEDVAVNVQVTDPAKVSIKGAVPAGEAIHIHIKSERLSTGMDVVIGDPSGIGVDNLPRYVKDLVMAKLERAIFKEHAPKGD